MSQDSHAQERTEQPTPKRLQKAREQGQVPRSRELNTMAVTLMGAAGTLAFGDWMMSGLREILIAGLSPNTAIELESPRTVAVLTDVIVHSLGVLWPLLVALVVAAVIGPMLLGGLTFSLSAARPKLERLSPLKGLKRIFSVQGLMELAKTVLKFSVLTAASGLLLWLMMDEIFALGRGASLQRIVDAAQLVQTAFFVLAVGLASIAAIDVPFQVSSHLKRLRMTRQEVKEELKESEGSPEVRQRVRRMQQDVAGRRMMEEIARADIVITNPTHFAVALRYTDRPDGAPRVVAKGRDLVAARIRELAGEHGVPQCSAPPLARALYFTTGLGEDIPAALYLAVARLLVWVMQLKAARETGSELPPVPTDLPVPEELSRAERSSS